MNSDEKTLNREKLIQHIQQLKENFPDYLVLLTCCNCYQNLNIQPIPFTCPSCGCYSVFGTTFITLDPRMLGVVSTEDETSEIPSTDKSSCLCDQYRDSYEHKQYNNQQCMYCKKSYDACDCVPF